MTTRTPSRLPASASPSAGHTWGDEMALVLVTVFWGTTFVVVGGLVARVPPAQVLVVRFVLAAALLLAIAARRWPKGDRALVRGGAVLGLWLAAGFGLQTVGLAYTTPARSAFITGFCVVVPALLAALEARRRPAARVVSAAAMAGAGVGLIGWPGQGSPANVGDVLTALCALAYGAHIHYTSRYAAGTRASAAHGDEGAGTAAASTCALTALQITVAAGVFCAISLLALGAIGLAPAGHAPAWAAALAGRPWDWSLPVAAKLLYLTLFATVLAYFLQTHSQRRVPAARAGILFALEPLVAALVSLHLGMDVLTTRLVAGGALVVGAIVVSSRAME